MPVSIDDLTSDFDAALARMGDEAIKEHDAIPPDQREAYYLASAASSLARLIELKAPQIILDGAEDRLARMLARRKRARSGRRPDADDPQ